MSTIKEISEIPEHGYFNKHLETECELFLIRYDEGIDDQIVKYILELEILK